LEGPLRATVQLTGLREGAARAVLGALREPFVETDAAWMTIGIDADLREALRRSARSAVVFLQSRIGLEKAAALAYLSSAADFGLCQVVNNMHSAYCRLRRDDFSEPHTSKPRLPRPGFARIVGSGDSSAATAPDVPDTAAPEAAVSEGSMPAVAAPDVPAVAAPDAAVSDIADPDAAVLGVAGDNPDGGTKADPPAVVVAAAVAVAAEGGATDSPTDQDDDDPDPTQVHPPPAVAPKRKQPAGRADRSMSRRRRTRPK
jgi:hypothetical protein